MKKIAVLCSHTPSFFWFRLDMMKAFIDKGCEVYAIGNEPTELWREKFKEHGIEYRGVVLERNGVNPLSDLKTLKSLKSLFAEIKPDKIWAVQAKAVIYSGIAASKLGIDFYPLIAGMGSLFLKDDIKTKIIRKVLITEFRIGIKNSVEVFFQNNDDLEMFRAHKVLKNQPVTMIPGSGVNTEKFSVLDMPEKFGFLCIGRLIRDKGIFEYLEACRIIKEKNPEVRCLLVGPFDSNPSSIKPEEIQPYVDDGIIEFFGEQEDVRPFFAQCNVYVLPSYREGTPKTNLEAMSCGRALITTDAPGCKETVEQGVNGFKVEVRSTRDLAEKMQYMIDNPETVKKMAAEGRKMAESRFDVKIVNEIICKTMDI